MPAGRKNQVWAYGRHRRRIVKNDSDNWLSPELKSKQLFSSDSESSCEHKKEDSGVPLFADILSTPKTNNIKSVVLAEETPDNFNIEISDIHNADNDDDDDDDYRYVNTKRRVCSPVSSLNFSELSKCLPSFTKPSEEDTKKGIRNDKKTRKYTKLSTRSRVQKNTEKDTEQTERDKIALDLSDIDKYVLAIENSTPKVEDLVSENTEATPPILHSSVCNEIIPNHSGGSIKMDYSTSTPYVRNNQGRSLQKNAYDLKCVSDAVTSGNRFKVKQCSVSLSKIQTPNFANVSQHNSFGDSTSKVLNPHNAGDCAMEIMNDSSNLSGHIEKTHLNTASDSSTNTAAQNASCGSVQKLLLHGSGAKKTPQQDCFVKLNALTPRTIDKHISRLHNDSVEDMELELSLLSIHSHSSEEADVEMEECAGVMTPAKKTVKSKQKAELFKEALTPCKPKDKIMSAREKVLLQCEQINTIPFTKCIPAAIRKKCCKIGEGTFGEVFRMEVRRHSLALKIIPIEGDFLVNDEPQKTFEDILPEIVISRELSALRYGVDNMTANYIELKDVSLIKGKYPQDLIKEWDKYDEKKTSENDRPDIFDSSQLFIIFEFNDGGCDLENFEFKNMQQMKSVFQQVTCSLAVAEKQLQFEHRDLHQGNILVAFTDTDNLHYVLDNEMYEIETHGVQVSLIDFTLSRLKKDGCTVFCNLAEDETLFQGQGDYQFEVYRLMKQYNKNDWEKSCLMTNVLWLHYLVDKLVNRDRRKFTRKQDKMIHKEFLSFYNEALKYHSAEEIFLNCKLCR